MVRFFYKVKNGPITQLVHKLYEKDNRIIYNNTYKRQIQENFSCESLKFTDIQDLEYQKEPLITYFEKYYKCIKEDYKSYYDGPKSVKDWLNISLRPGVNISSMKFSPPQVGFGSELNYRLGVEGEFILPFSKNKWDIIVEPTFQYFKDRKEVEGFDGFRVDYTSIELPFGIRHFFFLNEGSKIFTDFTFIYDLPFNSELKKVGPDGILKESFEIKMRNDLFFGFGVGYKFKDKYSLQFRYQTSHELLGYYLLWDSDYKTLSMILGITLY